MLSRLHVREGGVHHDEVRRRPGRIERGPLREQADPEEGELLAEVAAGRILGAQLAREVPPLRAVAGVRPVVAREAPGAPRRGGAEAQLRTCREGARHQRSGSGDPTQAHVGRINVIIGNEPGSLGSLTTIIGKHAGNITNLKITNRSQDFFEIIVDIEVQDVKHLTNIIAALRAAPSINSVDRARG